MCNILIHIAMIITLSLSNTGFKGEVINHQIDMYNKQEEVNAELIINENTLSGSHSYKICGSHTQIDSYDIIISYPLLYIEEDYELQKKINDVIKSEASSIMDSYKDENLEKFDLDIYYQINLANDYILSIEFYGFAFGEGYPRYDKIDYTTTIDLRTAKTLKLRDIVDINDELANLFINKKFDYVGPLQHDEEVIEEIYQNYNDLDELLKVFRKMDSEGIENSYLTEDGLVIVLDAGHAIGGYAEFRIDYKSIEGLIKIDILD